MNVHSQLRTYTGFMFVLLFALFVSCVKELPEEIVEPVEEEVPTVVDIPCEDELVSNFYEVDISIGGYSSFNVYSVNTIESFDSYRVNAQHFSTTTLLTMEIPDHPNTFIGRKSYDLKPINMVNETSARIFLKIQTFTFESYYYVPAETDTLYTDFYSDSIVFSLCNVNLECSELNSSLNLTGKIVATH
mgnify:CR=1 FL=1